MNTAQKVDHLVVKTRKLLQSIANKDYKIALTNALEEYEQGFNIMKLFYLLMLKKYPVSVIEFIESEKFLNMGDSLFPEVKNSLVDLNNPDGDRLSLSYYEAVLTGGIGTGKCVAIDTKIPTPCGFTTMRDVKVGDIVFDENGNQCNVTHVHPIYYDHDCYEIEFSDGTKVIADNNHKWRVTSLSQRANYPAGKGKPFSILSTSEMIVGCIKKNGQSNYAIDVSKPIICDQKNLHCDPYVLGAWLGDGSSDSANFWCDDPEIVEQMNKNHLVVRTGKNYSDIKYIIKGFHYVLKYYDLIKNKHIPDIIFRSSFEQRLSFLQGLMDTDGTIDKRQGRCCFTQSNKKIAYQVKELIETLGLQTKINKKKAGYRNTRGGYVECRESYEVFFTAPHPENFYPIFRLSRKLKYQGIRDLGSRILPSKRRYIKSIKPVPKVPVRCITVDSDSSLFLITESMIATHNTTMCLVTTAYQLYLLSCFRDVHTVLGQDKSAEILFIFQSLNSFTAKNVDYGRFRAMMEASPYFNTEFAFKRDIKSKLIFPNRIEVTPVSGNVTATIGQNVFGGFIDEVNFMEVVQNSKKNRDSGEYDQARELYNSISSRRSSRFMEQGVIPGILCLAASKNYPGQFTDKKYEESLEDSGIWYFDKTVWEMKPEKNFTGKWFDVFVGDFTHKPYIIDINTPAPPNSEHLVKKIPLEYKKKFENDIYNALREIAGVSTLAKSPFIPNVEAINLVFESAKESVFTTDECDFHTSSVSLKKTVIKNYAKSNSPCWAHIDLGLTSDSAGIVIGQVNGFQLMDEESTAYYMPEIDCLGVLEVKPPKNGEINFEKIRKIIIRLRDLGLPLKWVSFDSYQSVDSIQILRGKGFKTGYLSVDKTTEPYDFAKTAINENRVNCFKHDKLRLELIQLERVGDKVDHPSHGSKDVADSFAAVIYGLTTRLEIWHRFNIPINQLLQKKLKESKSQEGPQKSFINL